MEPALREMNVFAMTIRLAPKCRERIHAFRTIESR